MKEFLNHQIDDDIYPAMMVDGVGFSDYLVIVALEIKSDGTKKILGIREGSTENSEVCKSLISSLIERGLSVDSPRLFVFDGSQKLYQRQLKIYLEKMLQFNAAKYIRNGMLKAICLSQSNLL